MDASSGEAWSEMDISDPTNEIAHGRTLAETARFFAGGQVEVRYKMKESSEIEQLPPGTQWRGLLNDTSTYRTRGGRLAGFSSAGALPASSRFSALAPSR